MHQDFHIYNCCEGLEGPCNAEARRRGAATAYPYKGKGEDPNRDIWFCDPCAKLYYEYWHDMWSEYWSMVI